MAVGDKVTGLQAVTSFQTLRIRPPVGVEWTIHNIYHSRMAKLQIWTNTGTLTFDEHNDPGPGAWLGFWFNVTSLYCLQIQSLASTQQFVAYDGVQTK